MFPQPNREVGVHCRRSFLWCGADASRGGLLSMGVGVQAESMEGRLVVTSLRRLSAAALAMATLGFAVTAVISPPRAAAASGSLWGIDTIDNTQTLNDIGRTQTTLGAPQFVGRYLIWGGGPAIGIAEANNLHAQNLPILLLDSPGGTNLVGSSLGTAEAQAVVTQARAFNVPSGKAIFRDVEAGYGIDAAYIAAYYAVVEGAGYVPGFYENAFRASFNGAYCGAVANNAAIGNNTVLFANEPEFSAGDPRRVAMPSWQAVGPPCHQTTVAWQYEERGLFAPGSPAPNVDVDEYQAQYLGLLWGLSGSYQALFPQRILDTRAGLRAGTCSNGCVTLGPNSSLDLQVEGEGGVPSTGVSAVWMNVTVTNPTAGSAAAPNFVTVYPSGQGRPIASNLNFVAGQTVPNLVEAALGAGGRATLYNHAGNTDLIADVEAYVLSSQTNAGNGLYNAISPSRVGDTRAGSGQPDQGQTVGPNSIHSVQVSGMGGVPATGVSAVVLNVTVTNPTAGSRLAPNFATVFPGGANTPLASNLNFVAGQTVPNRVIVPVGSINFTAGEVWIYNRAGSSDFIVDVGGWFTDGSNPSASGAVLTAVAPTRICDTRPGTATVCTGRTLAANGALNLMVAGHGGVPSMGGAVTPQAVVANVTVTRPSAGSTRGPNFLTVYPGPANSSLPGISDLNFSAGETVPNLVVVKLGSDGSINLKVFQGTTDVIVDIVGWYG
jgi:Domain of unknown function (DUF1906)